MNWSERLSSESRWFNQIETFQNFSTIVHFSLPALITNYHRAAFDECCLHKVHTVIMIRVMKWDFNSTFGNSLTMTLSHISRFDSASKKNDKNLNPSNVIWIFIRLLAFIIVFQFVDSSISQIAQHSSVFVFFSYESRLFQWKRIKFPALLRPRAWRRREKWKTLFVLFLFFRMSVRKAITDKKKLDLDTTESTKSSAELFVFFR